MLSDTITRSPPVPPGDTLLRFFRSLDHLYVLIDTARDSRIISLLKSTTCKAHTLFSDHRAETLADYAPYLVEILPDEPFLEQVVTHWGDSWGIYATSDATVERLVEYFRSLLWAETPDGRMLFRFYDPRVLHRFLPAYNPE